MLPLQREHKHGMIEKILLCTLYMKGCEASWQRLQQVVCLLNLCWERLKDKLCQVGQLAKMYRPHLVWLMQIEGGHKVEGKEGVPEDIYHFFLSLIIELKLARLGDVHQVFYAKQRGLYYALFLTS